MVKAERDFFKGGRFAAAPAVARQTSAGALVGDADWPQPLQAPADTGKMAAKASGWWIAAAAPLGLAVWVGLGWLLFAS